MYVEWLPLIGVKVQSPRLRLAATEGSLVFAFRVYLGVKTCEVFLCFVAIVRVRV